VRRVFAALGYKVKRLERTKIGDLSDAALKPGAYRMLKRAEVEKLRARDKKPESGN
jgi:23S rRNA pseudouridine2605 synthase